MKNKIGIIFGLVLLLHLPAAHAEKVTMATGEWIPFTSETLKDYGSFTRIVDTVFKEMDLQPEYRFYPWPRCYDSVIKGRVWAAFPYSYTEERAKRVWYSNALSCSKTVFFYYEKGKAHKHYQFNKLEGLKQYKIGGVTGYFYEEWFREAGVEVDYANTEISGLEKLRLGRIDLLPLNDLVGWDLIKSRFPDEIDNFKALPKPFNIMSLRLIVSKDYPHSRELLDRFNEALKRCIEKRLVVVSECR